jgi:hypothetical protein
MYKLTKKRNRRREPGLTGERRLKALRKKSFSERVRRLQDFAFISKNRIILNFPLNLLVLHSLISMTPSIARKIISSKKGVCIIRSLNQQL